MWCPVCLALCHGGVAKECGSTAPCELGVVVCGKPCQRKDRPTCLYSESAMQSILTSHQKKLVHGS